LATGNEEKALELIQLMWNDNYSLFNYLLDHELDYMGRERQISVAILSQLVQILRQYGLNDKALEYQEELRSITNRM
jgi:hypothetical protein